VAGVAAHEPIDVIWGKTLDALRANPSLTAQNRSFVRLVKPLALVDDNVFLAVAEDFTKNYLETQLRNVITEALVSVLSREVRFAVTVDASVVPQDMSDADDEPEPRRSSKSKSKSSSSDDPHLNPRYT
jgi:chromosomal replication initiator protein